MGVRHVLAAAGLFVFLWMPATGYAKGADKLFEELKEGQSVRVEFSSKGCFHDETYEFEFRRAQTLAVTIVRVEKKWDDVKKEYVTTGRTSLGTVNVSDDEAAGLDRLLKFYRRPIADTACTTATYVSVTLREGEKVISEEQLEENTCSIQDIPGLTLFSDLTDKLLGKPKRVIHPRPETRHEKKMAIAMPVCQKITGYERLVNSFEITGASVTYFDGKPVVLSVEIEAKHPGIIDAAACIIPLLDENGEPLPSLNWDDFMKTFAAAEAVLSKHQWLREWKSLGKPGSWERTFELSLMGDKFDMGSVKEVLPLWRREGYTGQPVYNGRLFRGRGGFIEVYFSATDKRALMTDNFMPDPKSPSMIDRVDVQWISGSKSYSRYAVIESDGICRVETFAGGDAK